jgi:hypothetical protein
MHYPSEGVVSCHCLADSGQADLVVTKVIGLRAPGTRVAGRSGEGWVVDGCSYFFEVMEAEWLVVVEPLPTKGRGRFCNGLPICIVQDSEDEINTSAPGRDLKRATKSN